MSRHLSRLLAAALLLCGAAQAQTTLNTGTYTGQSYNGDVTIAGTVTFNGGSNFSDNTNLTFNTSTSLNWNQSGTINTTLVAVFGNGSTLAIGNAGSLTLAPSVSATGDISITGATGATFLNQGTLAYTQANNSGQIYAPTFTNAGTISALGNNVTLTLGDNAAAETFLNTGTITVDGTGGSATINLDGIANTGTLAATSGGVLRFTGPMTTLEIGTVTLTLGGRALIASGGVIDNTSGPTLGPVTGGTLELAGGTVNGGTIGDFGLTTSGGTINNAAFDGALAMPTSSFVTLGGATNFAEGAVATFGNGSSLGIAAAGTLTVGVGADLAGDVQVTSTQAGATFINQGDVVYNQANNSGQIYAPTFTNAGTITALGNNVTLTLGDNAAAETFLNTGTITVDGTGGSATINLDGIANTGTLAATNGGVLRFTGPMTTLEVGTVTLTLGGRALIASGGVIDNTAGPTLGPVGGGTLELAGGTINGGTIGDFALTTSGGTVNNAAFDGALAMPTSAFATLGGATSFTEGAVATFGNGASLGIAAAGTLTVGVGADLAGDVQVTSTQAGATFINQGDIVYNQANNSGQIYAPTFTNAGNITTVGNNVTLTLGDNAAAETFLNTGTITVDGTGGSATVNLDGVDNDGTLAASDGGVLRFVGAMTTQDIGTVTLSTGGRALIASGAVVDNTAGTLGPVTGGTLELAGGTINGGQIGQFALTTSGGTVNNAAFVGGLGMPTSAFATLGGTTTAESGAAFVFGNGSSLSVAAAGNFTLEAGATAEGDVQIGSSAAGAAFTNQGVITYNQANNSGQIYAPAFTNAGQITATGTNVTLTLGSNPATETFLNTGTITADGTGGSATVNLDGVDNDGTLAASDGGVLRFVGAMTTQDIGTVTLNTGGRALIASGGVIDNTAGPTLGPVTGGTLELAGGTINGGTIGSFGLTTSGGTVTGAAFTGNLALPTSAFANIGNGTSLGASAAAAFGNGASLNILGNSVFVVDAGATVSGDVQVTSVATGAAFVNHGEITYDMANNSGQIHAPTFTNNGLIKVVGNNVTLTLGSTPASENFTNTGTITADGAGGSASINLNGIDNNGMLTAVNGGVLRFTGAMGSADFGGVSLDTGGRALIASGGVIDNNGYVITSFDGGDVFELAGGTVNSGTIGNFALTTSGGSLNNVTFNGSLALPTSAFATLGGTTQFTGASVAFGNGSSLLLGAGANVTFAGMATGDLQITSTAADAVLVNQGGLTYDMDNNSGQIYAPTFTNQGTITVTGSNTTLTLGVNDATENFTNTGSIVANGAGATMQLDGIDNNGTLTAISAGTLRFIGMMTSTDIGTVQLSGGGRALIGSGAVIDNAGQTFGTGVTGGLVELAAGTINGGTIVDLATSTSGGTINGATFTGNFMLPTSSFASLGNGNVFASGSTTTFGNGAQLSIAANATVTLQAGSLYSGDVSITSSNSGATLVNQGQIIYSASSNSGSVFAPSFENAGTISMAASGSTLTLGSGAGQSTTNAASGVISQTAGNISLGTGPFTNLGLFHLSAGTLNISGTLLNDGGGILKGAGLINGDVTFDGGTLAPGNSVGTLTINNSDFVVTAASTFEVELSGSTADALVFSNPTSPVNIGAGLLDLSVVLLTAPTIGHTYNVLSIASGGSGITGHFTGLANSGDSLYASFGGTPYQFTVNYQLNVASITAVAAVPEPGTYALFALGLGLLALSAWRRRPRRGTVIRAVTVC